MYSSSSTKISYVRKSTGASKGFWRGLEGFDFFLALFGGLPLGGKLNQNLRPISFFFRASTGELINTMLSQGLRASPIYVGILFIVHCEFWDRGERQAVTGNLHL